MRIGRLLSISRPRHAADWAFLELTTVSGRVSGPPAIVKRRYNGSFNKFEGGLPPTIIFQGTGEGAKQVAIGMEELVYIRNVIRHGKDQLDHAQRPVRMNRPDREAIVTAAKAWLRENPHPL